MQSPWCGLGEVPEARKNLAGVGYIVLNHPQPG